MFRKLTDQSKKKKKITSDCLKFCMTFPQYEIRYACVYKSLCYKGYCINNEVKLIFIY